MNELARRARQVLVAVVCGLGWLSPAAEGATLAAVKESGSLTVCAHPDALPFSSQDPAQRGFQLDIAQALAQQLGVRLNVSWIVYTRHARRAQCDAVMGSIVQLSDAPKGKAGPLVTKAYAGGGYILVVPSSAPDVGGVDGIKGGKIGVEHTSWPHYMLSTRKIPTSSFASQSEILEAVAKGELAGGLVTGPYLGWYLKHHPAAVKAGPMLPEPELRWNVAIRLLSSDQAMVDALNALIDRLVTEGTIRDIFAKYGIAYVPPALP